MIAPGGQKRPLRILCVEEDAIQRKLLEACFEVMGAEGLIVPRPLDAIWMFRKTPVDMVFLDIDMHVADGLTAFEAIRSTPVRGRTVPILAVTENECRWTEMDYRDAGFAGLFLKPVEPTRLFAKIDETMRSWHPPKLRSVENPAPRPPAHFGHARNYTRH